MDSPQRLDFDVVRLTITIAIVGLVFSIAISVLASMRAPSIGDHPEPSDTVTSAQAISVDSTTD